MEFCLVVGIPIGWSVRLSPKVTFRGYNGIPSREIDPHYPDREDQTLDSFKVHPPPEQKDTPKVTRTPQPGVWAIRLLYEGDHPPTGYVNPPPRPSFNSSPQCFFVEIALLTLPA